MEKLKIIFAEVLTLEVSQITNELSRNDIEEWDSFNHLLLISEIEKEFGVQFTIDEVSNIQSFKQVHNLVISKK